MPASTAAGAAAVCINDLDFENAGNRCSGT
jgi:hypothetical protein